MFLPCSARQKEEALGSMSEVVQTVKRPRPHIQSKNDVTHEKEEKLNLDYMLPISAEIEKMSTPARQTSLLDPKSDAFRRSSVQESSYKSQKSGRTSFMG